MSTNDEPFTLRWLRRALSFSAYGALFATLVVASPLFLLVVVTLDLLFRSRWSRLRTFAMLVCYVACELIGLVGAFGVWLRGGEREQFLQRNFRLQAWWAGTLFDLARRLFALDVQIENGAACMPGPVLILIRHASLADTLLPVALLSRAFGLQLRHVLKRELLWDPCLDVVGNRLPNAFVRRGGHDPEREVAIVRALREGLGPKDGVLIFPEGTRASPSRRARVLAALAASSSTPPDLLARATRLRHLLPPRRNGLAALLDDIATAADVVLIGHVGFDGMRGWSDLTGGALIGRRIRIKLWRLPAADLPTEPEARFRAVLDAWQTVDDWIDGCTATR